MFAKLSRQVPKANRMNFEYQLSEKFRSAEFIRSGIRPDLNQVIEINPIESTVRVRELYEFFVSAGRASLPSQDRVLAASDVPEVLEQMQAKEEAKKAEEVAKALESVKKFLEDAGRSSGGWLYDNQVDSLMRKLSALGLDTSELQDAIEKNDVKVAQDKADRIAQQERQETADAGVKAAKAAEKVAWIEANGSAHLKRAHQGGFNCHRKYIKERAAFDLPGCMIDWNDDAKWVDCACPSMAALDALEAAPEDAKLVWLKLPPAAQTEEDYYDGDNFEPCEAIVIRAYLGSKYDLVKVN
jgi:hypothetical protein